MGFKLIALAASTLILSTSVSAALIDNGSFTSDTVGGLDWLDVTETTGLSYDFVSGQLGTGGIYDGWRYATSSESENLFLQFGFSSNSLVESPPSPSNMSAFNLMLSLLGNTANNPNTPATVGIIGHSTIAGFHKRPSVAYNIFVDLLAVETLTDFTIDQNDTSSDSEIGHFLVRPAVVPVPAAVWLFGTGLLGLVGVARRKKS